MSFQEDKKELEEKLKLIKERIEISEDGLKNYSEGALQFLIDILKEQVRELKAQYSLGQLVLGMMEDDERNQSDTPQLELDKRFS